MTLNYNFEPSRFKVSVYTLAFFWSAFLCLGLLSGCYCADNLNFPVVHLLTSGKSIFIVSLFRLIIILIGLILIQISLHWGLILLASVRGMSLGFLLGISALCFGSAGWLYVFLFNFDSLVFSFCDLWLWNYSLNGKLSKTLILAGIFVCVNLLTIIFDILILDPFRSGLYNV